MTYRGGDIVVDDILGGYLQGSLYKNLIHKVGAIYFGDMPF